jgi:hypothetical protein
MLAPPITWFAYDFIFNTTHSRFGRQSLPDGNKKISLSSMGMQQAAPYEEREI